MIRIFIQSAILAALWLVTGSLAYWLHPQARVLFEGGQIAVPQDEGEISLAEAKRHTADNKVIWVDVRPAPEFAKEHVPGAENVPANESGILESKLFEWTQSERLRPDTRIIMYCASAGCGTSHQLRQQLRTMNPALDVVVLAGGWSEWKRGESQP
jgi:rhodanese-related sulfurtransferase